MFSAIPRIPYPLSYRIKRKYSLRQKTISVFNAIVYSVSGSGLKALGRVPSACRIERFIIYSKVKRAITITLSSSFLASPPLILT